MSVFRVNKTKDFTVMSNHHLRDKSLSLKAKGLLSVMLSLPDSWDYSIAGLVAICKENETAIESALFELKKRGYITVTKQMPDTTQSGRIEYVYDIYETPRVENQGVEKQGVENLPLENQAVENQGQLSTEESNTEVSSTDNKKKARKSARSFDAIINAYTESPSTRELLGEWLQNRKAKRAAMTDNAIKRNIDKLDECARQSGMTVDAYLDEVIRRGWSAFFPIAIYNGKAFRAPQQPKPMTRENRETIAALEEFTF